MQVAHSEGGVCGTKVVIQTGRTQRGAFLYRRDPGATSDTYLEESVPVPQEDTEVILWLRII